MAFDFLSKSDTIKEIRPEGRFFKGDTLFHAAQNFFGCVTTVSDSNMQNFINYLKDTRAEMKHVSWPTKRQAAVSTALVIAISIVVALYLGALDYVLGEGLKWFKHF